MFPFSFVNTDYTVDFGMPSATGSADSQDWAYSSFSEAMEHLLLHQQHLTAKRFSFLDMPLGAEDVFTQWERDAAAHKVAPEAKAQADSWLDLDSGFASDSGYETDGTESPAPCTSSCDPSPVGEDFPSTPTTLSHARSASVVSYATAWTDDDFEEDDHTECDSEDEYVPESSTSRKRGRGKTGPSAAAPSARKRVKLENDVIEISGQDHHAHCSPSTSGRLSTPSLASSSKATYVAGSDEEVTRMTSSVPPAEHYGTPAALAAAAEELAYDASAQPFRWTHNIDWSEPPRWGDDVIPEMPGEAIVGYLKRKYQLKDTVTCLYNGCGKEVSVNGSLKNHLANGEHMDLRKECVRCGWSIRHDMWKKRAPGHPGCNK
ncbi:hypothetical protein OH77DRAFT_1523318 [Trametes cingulata]|nr:hypothetical protein OH77DRAFT_1523318 [Trametes cingulata]